LGLRFNEQRHDIRMLQANRGLDMIDAGFNLRSSKPSSNSALKVAMTEFGSR
jgi:hypothetical protein